MFTSKKAYVEDTPLEGWAFAKEDMSIVRHYIKNIKNLQIEVQQRKKR